MFISVADSELESKDAVLLGRFVEKIQSLTISIGDILELVGDQRNIEKGKL